MPLILTVVILLWLGQGVYSYIVRPISVSVQWAYAGSLNESVGFDPGKFRLLDASEYEGVGKNNGIEREDLPKLYKLREDPSREYVVINGEAVPFEDYHFVVKNTTPAEMPRSSRGIYMFIATEQHFRCLLYTSPSPRD